MSRIVLFFDFFSHMSTTVKTLLEELYALEPSLRDKE